VASPLVAALRAPLLELQASVGSGVFAGDDAAKMLRDASGVLEEVAATGMSASHRVGEQWSGLAAGAAADVTSTAFTSAQAAAVHSSQIAATVGAASEAVARANADLRRIVDDFTANAHALERGLPASAGALIAAAQRALHDAVGVVAALDAELGGHAATITATGGYAAPPPAAGPVTSALPTVPSAVMSGMSSIGGVLPGLASSALAAVGPLAGAFGGDIAADPAPASQLLADHPAADPAVFGSGVAVHLPDGSTATAPNALAANAVRNALTQLGVPYQWGGTTPGVGLDCSGLTQWAYHEAGLNLPRLAQEQDVGAAVSAGALLPGDLAVWDGHVAMVVGNGMMVEAGDPVQLSPIRTTNAGQGFQGFFRPTV
jgi:cell wall-associated NlpC family hydrolase